MASNFQLLQSEWPAIYDAAARAEAAVNADPRTACFYARRALELVVSWAYKHDAALKLPYQDNLSALIHEPHYAIKNVALVKFTELSPSAVFIRHRLSCHYFDHIVSQKNRGGTQKIVSFGDLRAFPLPLPPTEQQRVFTSRVHAVAKLGPTNRGSLAELDALFASLQHRAFRGEL